MSWSDQSWREAAKQYHRDRAGRPLIVEIEHERLKRLGDLLKDSTSFPAAYYEIACRDGDAPKPIVEALMFSLRSRGTGALKEGPTKRRLGDLNEQQLHEVCGRLQRLKPHIAPAWAPEQITALVDAWNRCHA